MTTFSDLGLAAPILRALAQEGHETPTPIQAQAIPQVMEGRDLLGIAQTGTGKTAAFALPILHRLASSPKRPQPRSVRVLVLSPTRELSAQILERFQAYGRHVGISSTIVIGGVPLGRQRKALSTGVDVVVATPGRLLDHCEQNAVRLDQVEVLVLDEADQMLDMGFIPAIRQIVAKLPAQRQNLFFSATMPKEIGALAGKILHDPVQVAVTAVARTADKVAQEVRFHEPSDKPRALANLLSQPGVDRALVFTRTKRGADKVVKTLDQAGIGAEAIHGNKSQPQREKTLSAFRNGRVRVLIATDIAARGIDVDGVSHVVNYELPNVPESYVHRIGRTARAGATGIAVSFCSREERPYLRDIEKLIKMAIPIVGDDKANWTPLEAGAAIVHVEEPKRESRRGGGQRNERGEGQRRGGRGDRRRERPAAQPEARAEWSEAAPAEARSDARPARQDRNRNDNRPQRQEGNRPAEARSEGRPPRQDRSRNDSRRPQQDGGRPAEARPPRHERNDNARPQRQDGGRPEVRADGRPPRQGRNDNRRPQRSDAVRAGQRPADGSQPRRRSAEHANFAQLVGALPSHAGDRSVNPPKTDLNGVTRRPKRRRFKGEQRASV